MLCVRAGTWSPQRPGVFFTIKMDGTLDVWDLFYRHNEPTLTVQVCWGLWLCACTARMHAFCAGEGGCMQVVVYSDDFSGSRVVL